VAEKQEAISHGKKVGGAKGKGFFNEKNVDTEQKIEAEGKGSKDEVF